MKKIIFKILTKTEQYLPKNKKILFHSFPDYSDNSYAIFKNMLTNKIQINNLIWLYDKDINLHEKIFNEFGLKIKCYKKNSLKGIWSFFRSRKVFSTHGIFSLIETKNKKINLWHGMPLKNIGFMDKESKAATTCDYIIATSNIFKELMAKSFNKEYEKVFLTGQPRNDLLFEKTKFYEKMGINDNSYNKKIIYLPTYRKSIIGDIRNDGEYNQDKLGIIKIDRLNELNENLSKNNNLMLIKLHPMDILQEVKFQDLSNIIILKTEDLKKVDEQLYPLLGSTDLLITDYSSVWVDYEILGKPIYFAMDDYEKYKSNRGFTIENLPKFLPGDIIQDFEELLKKLDNIPEKIQKDTGNIFNKYKDNKSSERVLKALGIV
ncbi:MAG: CDP-glycerol glycerophosphotransferase family protein [Bacilli bacterium]